MNKNMNKNLNQILEELDLRFTSGNDIPVERATIKRSEYEAIRTALQELIQGKWGVDTMSVLRDLEWSSGAQFGWNCGQTDDHQKLDRAIESKISERVDLKKQEEDQNHE